jgi:isopenicillin N synthase-like dioxygenase
MQDFPVIDISSFSQDTANAKKALARRVDQACREIGFLAIGGHGVSQEIVSSLWNASTRFFDLSLEKKLRVAMRDIYLPYGYAPLQAEILAKSLGVETPPDLKESFSAGPLDRKSPAGVVLEDNAETAFRFADNLWPDQPIEFREAWSAYYRAMEKLAETIMRIFAVALDLPEDFFADKIDRHISAMRLLNYPDLETPPAPGQLRAGPHTDYGSVTILLTEQTSGGLELYTSGQWREVPFVPGTFIVNIGDLLARWTNDRWVSTLHRVVCPPAEAKGSSRRQSIAFFHQPNWDAEISCVPTCLAPGEKATYPPVRSGPHLMEKFHRSLAATQ